MGAGSCGSWGVWVYLLAHTPWLWPLLVGPQTQLLTVTNLVLRLTGSGPLLVEPQTQLPTVTDSYKLGVAPHWLGALARGAKGHLKLDRNSVLRLKLCVVQPDKRSL